MKKQKKAEPFVHSPHATLSPMSPRHPSNPIELRRRPKPKLTPVLRPIFHPDPSVYPAPFRGRQ